MPILVEGSSESEWELAEVPEAEGATSIVEATEGSTQAASSVVKETVKKKAATPAPFLGPLPPPASSTGGVYYAFLKQHPGGPVIYSGENTVNIHI